MSRKLTLSLSGTNFMKPEVFDLTSRVESAEDFSLLATCIGKHGLLTKYIVEYKQYNKNSS